MEGKEDRLVVYLPDLRGGSGEFDGELDCSIYGFTDEYLRPFGGLRYALGVQLFGNELLARGRLEQDFEAVCSRCGKDFDFTAKVPDFAASVVVDEKEGFADLTDELRESILLSLSAYPVCREDCPGVVMQGEKELPDSRWDALDGLKKKG